MSRWTWGCVALQTPPGRDTAFVLSHTPDELIRYLAVRQDMSGAGALSEIPVPTAMMTTVVSLDDNNLVLRRQATPEDLRPGRIWSGPALLSFVDTSGYLMTVAHLPPGSDAVTVDLTIKFLRPAPFADLVAATRLLRMSKRRADMDITVSSSAVAEGPVAHATATFAPRPVAGRP
jgi:acyl-coenzyme A thioesterase PaaI-like protein